MGLFLILWRSLIFGLHSNSEIPQLPIATVPNSHPITIDRLHTCQTPFEPRYDAYPYYPTPPDTLDHQYLPIVLPTRCVLGSTPHHSPSVPSAPYDKPVLPQLTMAISFTCDTNTTTTDYVRRCCFNCCTTETTTWRRSKLSSGKIVFLFMINHSFILIISINSFVISVDYSNALIFVLGPSKRGGF